MGLQKGIFLSKYGYLEYMGVSKNRGILPPKWMVYFMENSIKMAKKWGAKTPYFWFNTHIGLGISHIQKPIHLPCHRMPRLVLASLKGMQLETN